MRIVPNTIIGSDQPLTKRVIGDRTEFLTGTPNSLSEGVSAGSSEDFHVGVVLFDLFHERQESWLAISQTYSSKRLFGYFLVKSAGPGHSVQLTEPAATTEDPATEQIIIPVAHLALVLLVVLLDQRLRLAQRHRRQSNISGATLVTFLLWSSKGIGR